MMRRTLPLAIGVSALLLTCASPLFLVQPAEAAVGFQIGFNFFQDRLAPYGGWMYHPVFGEVWRPRPSLVGPDFQPYLNGYWTYTDEYGWYWVSEDPFDDVVYHYGRWFYDPQGGWLWVPGYTWAPAWVVWREGDDYTGWMPMPPDEAFVSGTGLSFGVNLGPIGINFYRNWYGGRVDPDRFFVFVNNRYIVDRDYRRFRVPRDRVKIILNRTRNVTKFEVVNNRVVNRGVDVKVVERATGRRIAPVSAKTVIKPNAIITTVDEGKHIRERSRPQQKMDVEKFRRVERGQAKPGEVTMPANGANENANAPGGPNATPGGGGRNRPGGENMTGPGQGAGNENATNPAAGQSQSGSTTGNRPSRGNQRGNQTGPGENGPAANAPNGPANAGAGSQTPNSGATPNRRPPRGQSNAPGGENGPAGPGMNGPGGNPPGGMTNGRSPNQGAGGNPNGMGNPTGTGERSQRRGTTSESTEGTQTPPNRGNNAGQGQGPGNSSTAGPNNPRSQNQSGAQNPPSGSADQEQKDKRKRNQQTQQPAPPGTPQQ